LTVAGQSWRAPVFPRVALQCALVAGILGATAVQEFAERGGGTPFPFDPPKRLVRGGIYAYLRNPMQLSATLLFLILAATERSTSLALAAAVCVAFSAGFAAWDERTELAARFTGEWTSYAGAVRNWIPSWRPRIDEPSPAGSARSGHAACSSSPPSSTRKTCSASATSAPTARTKKASPPWPARSSTSTSAGPSSASPPASRSRARSCSSFSTRSEAENAPRAPP
jgi:hypothetical protein